MSACLTARQGRVSCPKRDISRPGTLCFPDRQKIINVFLFFKYRYRGDLIFWNSIRKFQNFRFGSVDEYPIANKFHDPPDPDRIVSGKIAYDQFTSGLTSSKSRCVKATVPFLCVSKVFI